MLPSGSFGGNAPFMPSTYPDTTTGSTEMTFFFIKVEKIIGLVKLETGEKLTMPEDYLAAGGILPEATEVGKRACEKEPKVPEAPPGNKDTFG